MGNKFDLASIMEKQMVQPSERSIETITQEILDCKAKAGEAILRIGQCLNEAKMQLTHGEWLPWLEEKVEFSERTAQNFMRLARTYSNPQTLADLGASKALALLALPPEEREQFIADPHTINGENKTVIDMSARELEQAIRDRDEARKQAEDLERDRDLQVGKARADAETAKKSADKMAEDMRFLKERLSGLEDQEQEARDRAARLESELEELRAKPVDVAVMEVDQEALEQAKREAVAELEQKLKDAKAEQDSLRSKLKDAKGQLHVSKAEQEQAKAEAERLRKELAVSADKDVAAFGVYFEQGQEAANRMAGVLKKMRGKGDDVAAAKLAKAMLALCDAIRGAAE